MSWPPRTTALLPLAYVLHLMEEWFGDLPSWTVNALGNEISVERFVLINAVAFPVFLVATIVALRSQRLAWIATALAALFGFNALLHTLATLSTGLYAPGVVSGLLVYAPLSTHILWRSTRALQPGAFAKAVAVGALLHAVVSFVAFL